MATYNWTANPYFTTNRYKAPTGSDTTGDGTANKPYRTIQKCIDSGGVNIQCAPEVIREQWTGSPYIFFERGCIIDQFGGGEVRGTIYGVKSINTRISSTNFKNDISFASFPNDICLNISFANK